MFDISFTELMLIGMVALVIIGPERLPKVAKTVGHLLGRAQRYVSDVKGDIQREVELDDLRKMKEDMESAARSMQSSMQQTESKLRKEMQSPLDDFKGEVDQIKGGIDDKPSGVKPKKVEPEISAQPETDFESDFEPDFEPDMATPSADKTASSKVPEHKS